jgi:stage V sporulation protein R
VTEQELHALEAAIDQIVARAREFGLDFFPMRYELCPADIIYTFGAYAMPTRFSHWSFGKAFHQMRTQHQYGLSKIYELVINSDPCYAFLLDTNTLLQNKLIAAHVLAHCDFFKNNWRFAGTNRQMVQSMASFANRVLAYEQQHGRATVEKFLDAVLSIHEHIDPYPRRQEPTRATSGREPVKPQEPKRAPASPYDDLWALDARSGPAEVAVAAEAPPTPHRDRDLLRFLLAKGDHLAPWQQDILSSVREESLYFRPQMETKIMNEGWASFWHLRIMRSLDLTPQESIDFAQMHAAVLAPSRTHLNPYFLGLHIFEDIAERYGMDRAFEVRAVESDVSFIRNYLNEALVEKLDLYLYGRRGEYWEVTENAWQRVRDGIVHKLTNCGFPYIYAADHNHGRRGELYLVHGYEGVELDPAYLARTLEHVQQIWERPVHLETVENDQTVVYTCTEPGEVRRRAPAG